MVTLHWAENFASTKTYNYAKDELNVFMHTVVLYKRNRYAGTNTVHCRKFCCLSCG